jgi:hypothetical protein
MSCTGGRSTSCTGCRAEAKAAAASFDDFSIDSRIPRSASSNRSQVTNPLKSGIEKILLSSFGESLERFCNNA